MTVLVNVTGDTLSCSWLRSTANFPCPAIDLRLTGDHLCR